MLQLLGFSVGIFFVQDGLCPTAKHPLADNGKLSVLQTHVSPKDGMAVLYDAPGGNSTSDMRRDIGLAWLNLPLIPPGAK